jgi:hypothetical protein
LNDKPNEQKLSSNKLYDLMALASALVNSEKDNFPVKLAVACANTFRENDHRITLAYQEFIEAMRKGRPREFFESIFDYVVRLQRVGTKDKAFPLGRLRISFGKQSKGCHQ